MARIVVFIEVEAPIDRVFDLCRCVDLHIYRQGAPAARTMAGTRSGLLTLGQEITLKTRYLVLWQKLTAQVTEYDRPHHMSDAQVRGGFKRFKHDRYFTRDGGRTVVKEVIEYTAPYGIIGKAADRLFLERYTEKLMKQRAATLKRVAESNDWKDYLAADAS